jgi:glycosyltransferase involved in cell wall biosynthesis
LPVYLMLVGDGDLRSGLENLASELRIQSRVIFTGARADVDQFYACMDLFVSASLWEGIPTVVLESMAAGIPVVATAIPGHQAIIENGVHGWLVPAGEAGLLADAITHAIVNPNERTNRAQRAKFRVQDFSIETVLARHAELYEELALD